ncbi:hypothetical protein WH52_01445 [Tenacibaculum holothuriorum]|uniref:Uncharacterized protein n=1 Tax=Tenacibaculum holothuriorum TaxID=1635173 RepID=A0A1Y2PGP1_9FLAO|nr:hypothetical protein [Tenacibaculum holothuriorum]OSY89330.1 hypothetical protein WH52_01445 [Tenacibaculum holothuriorum]
MKNYIKHITNIGFFLLLFFSFGFKSETKEIKHKIQVIHPGKDLKEPVETILVERLNKNNETLEFYVNVESVICSDNTCKIVPVNIFWDINGEYNRIELEEGGYLEKIEGVEFNEDDYLKLDGILKNKNSALADYDINEIIDKNKKSKQQDFNFNFNADVDAVSGATIITIDESETIVGATLTSYTLWHWVNGPIPQIIKKIMVEKLSQEGLINLLNTSGEKQVIALEEISKRKLFNKAVRNIVVENIASENIAYRKEAFAYIKKLPKAQHFEALREIFNKKDDKIRFKALYLVEDSPYPISQNFSAFLTKNIIEKENQKEIEKLLDIYQGRKKTFSTTNQEIIKLLDSENFSIARNAYEFLKDKALFKTQQKLINKFYNTHKTALENTNKYQGF